MDVANEILDAIEIIVDKKIKEQTTQIYFGICKSVNENTCVMTINGKENTVQFYGTIPIVGVIYRVFVPYGNMSMAFIITTNNTSESSVSSVNGLTGDVKLTANNVGAIPQGKRIFLYDGLSNEVGYIDTAGWYRIVRTKSVSSFLIHIGHTWYNDGPGDLLAYIYAERYAPKIIILSNTFKDNYQFYTKLRFTRDSTYGYIDFYYNKEGARANPAVSFIEFFIGGGNHITEPQPLTPVAESPSGETIFLTQNIGVIASGNITTTSG